MIVLPLLTALAALVLAAVCTALVCGALHLTLTTPTPEKETR